MKCLVTGGAGFVGSRLSAGLLARDHEVVVYDNLSVGRRENVPAAAHFLKGDILDRELLGRAMRGMDIVFHNAAFVSIRNSFLQPRLESEVNETGTLNVLDAMVETGVSKIVFASSMAVYGIPRAFCAYDALFTASKACLRAPRGCDLQANPSLEQFPFSKLNCSKKDMVCEGDMVQPISPYGLSKLKGEMLCRIYSEQHGISYNALRYFNIFGEGQTYSEYVGVLTAFVNMARAGKPMTVCGDGLQERDFVYVGDVAEANILAMGNLKNSVYNIGSGTRTSILSLAEAVQRGFKDTAIVYVPRPPGEIQTICADTEAARRDLGFVPSKGILAYVSDFCSREG